MNPFSIKAEIMFGLFLLSLGGAGGYAAAVRWATNDISSAKSDTAVCVSVDAGNQAVIDQLQAKYKDLKDRHDKLVADADQGLADRDVQIAALKAAMQKRKTAITEKPHDAETATLDGVPLPPAIARELWPAAAETGGGDPRPNG